MPLALDSRLPLDCLFMIFEEDFRFWPVNQDPDLIDYDKRVMSLLKFRKERASSSNQGSLPPLEEDTPLPPWRSTKRRGQEKPEGRFFLGDARVLCAYGQGRRLHGKRGGLGAVGHSCPQRGLWQLSMDRLGAAQEAQPHAPWRALLVAVERWHGQGGGGDGQWGHRQRPHRPQASLLAAAAWCEQGCGRLLHFSSAWRLHPARIWMRPTAVWVAHCWKAELVRRWQSSLWHSCGA